VKKKALCYRALKRSGEGRLRGGEKKCTGAGSRMLSGFFLKRRTPKDHQGKKGGGNRGGVSGEGTVKWQLKSQVSGKHNYVWQKKFLTIQKAWEEKD